MRNLFLFSLMLLLAVFAFSSMRPTNKMKFGKIPMEQLMMTTCDLDSTADAVVLGDFRRYSMDWVPNVGLQIYINVYHRVKVLNNEGFE